MGIYIQFYIDILYMRITIDIMFLKQYQPQYYYLSLHVMGAAL